MNKNKHNYFPNLINVIHSRTTYTENGYRFSFDAEDYQNAAKIGVAFFDISSGKLISKIPFEQKSRVGSIYSSIIDDFNPDLMSYTFYADDKFIMDERAGGYCNTLPFGGFDTAMPLKAVFRPAYDWKDDIKPDLSFEESFIYQLHVRGFTKHDSSSTKYKGTFRGIQDKIAYLKDLGVTTLELQPAYEFNECDKKTGKLNYWGYCRGYYYAPKAAYAFSDSPYEEFCDLVRKLHMQNMEIILQMYFPADFSRREIPEILEYWVTQFHIDGFHLMGENLPLNLIYESSLLKGTKIISDYLYGLPEKESSFSVSDHRKLFALSNYDYMYGIRKFLKSDINSLGEACNLMKGCSPDFAKINFLDSYNGLTLSDMVTYDVKHNELNGESNTDGTDYNCSWNCGEEGPSKKQKIVLLRKKQIYNALTLLFLSTGTPMIFMGDEFGNSQSGNNNPYCQDNSLTWLDWSGLKRKSNITSFIKSLVSIRNANPVLKASKELSMVDMTGCGYPELSYHCGDAWKSSFDGYSHNIGILYCMKDKLIFLAVNFNWNDEKFSLPRPPKGTKWNLIFSTDKITAEDKSGIFTLADRSVAVFEPVSDTDGLRDIDK